MSKLNLDKEHDTCWNKIRNDVLIEPSTEKQIEILKQLPAEEKNAIIFVLACWCGHCIQCKETVNELFAALVKLEHKSSSTSSKPLKLPVVMYFDADVYTSTLNEMLEKNKSKSRIQGYPTVLLVKGKTIESHDGPRNVESITKAWKDL